jgi:hypothetical protein
LQVINLCKLVLSKEIKEHKNTLFENTGLLFLKLFFLFNFLDMKNLNQKLEWKTFFGKESSNDKLVFLEKLRAD